MEPEDKPLKGADLLDEIPPELLDQILADARMIAEMYATTLRALAKY